MPRRGSSKPPAEPVVKPYGCDFLFLKNQGRVFTRDELLNLVWGYEFIGEQKSVNFHIMNLRKKLGVDYIETVRGVGYKIAKENQ